MKKLPFAFLSALLGFSSPLQGIESIGWSYGRMGRTDDVLTPEQLAGAPSYEQSGWNNHVSTTVQGIGTVPFALKDNSGNETTASLSGWTISFSNGYSTYSPGSYSGDDPDEKLMNSYTAENPVLTFSGIPGSYQDSGYVVVIYYRGGGMKTLEIAGTADDHYSASFSAGGNQYKDVGYIEWVTGGSNPTNTNYTVVKDLDDAGFTVSGRGIFAIQIVKQEGVPSAPSEPDPQDYPLGAVPVSSNLSWSASKRATSYDVYLWTADEDEPTEPTDTVLTNVYDPPSGLEPLTDYYWKVVAKNDDGGTPGNTWFFFTGDGGLPGQVSWPIPGDESSEVPVDALFYWDPADSALSYSLYLWPSSETRPEEPVWTGADLYYQPTAYLQPSTEYTWQVVAVNSEGNTPGPEWTFTTSSFYFSDRASIGWNHDGRYDGLGDSNALIASDGAGAPGFGQKNWNNHVRTTRTQPNNLPLALGDNSGNPTTANLSAWVSDGNSWRLAYVSETNNDKLMKTYVAKQPSLTFSDIPEEYRQSGYSVVVYYANADGARDSVLAVSGEVDDYQSRLIQAGPDVAYPTSGFVEETGNHTGPSNYTVFTGFNDSSVTISLTNDNGNGIAAIQLVKEEGAPNAPTGAFPADQAEEVSIDLPLSWQPSLRTETYEVYLWESTSTKPEAPTAIVVSPSYDPSSGLEFSTGYHWQVVAVNEDGEAPGPVWTFTTGADIPPDQASNPSPADDSVGVAFLPVFGWDEAARTSSYEFFLWKSTETAPLEATATSMLPGYTPDNPLEVATEYLWRVDTINSGHRTTGAEWSFTIGVPPAAVAAPSPLDGSTVARTYGSLSWTASPGAESYNVYFWVTGETPPETPTATLSANENFQTQLLEAETSYSWRVDPVNAFGVTTGPEWTFTTSSAVSSRNSIGWKHEYQTPVLAETAVAGAPGFRQAYWNRQPNTQAPLLHPDFKDSSGTATSMGLTAWTNGNNSYRYYAGGPPAANYSGKVPYSDALLTNSFAIPKPALTFSNIPYANYDVVVYYGKNDPAGATTLQIAAGATVIASREVNAAGPAPGGNGQSGPYLGAPYNIGYVESTDETPTTTKTNYTVFTNVSEPELTVSIPLNNAVGISAVQFIERTPEEEGDYDNWATTKGLSGADADFDADPDHDGIRNGIEFVIGGEPSPTSLDSNSQHLLTPVQADGDSLVYTYTRTHASSSIDVIVEFSSTLDGDWIVAQDGVNATIATDPGPEADTVTVTIPKNGAEKLFVRLRASVAPSSEG